MTKLAGLQFKLQYKRGPENKVADALSRVGQLCTIQAVSAVVLVRIQEMLNSYTVDDVAQ